MAVCWIMGRTMKCVNCGHENRERSLICYWCGLDPATGEQPYPALTAPGVKVEQELVIPEITLPPPIQLPTSMPVPDVTLDTDVPELIGVSIPELPPIEIPPPLEIPEQGQFTIVRRRVRHRPRVLAVPARPVVTRPVLPGWGRVLVFVAGLGLLFLLGTELVAAIGATSLGSAFCLLGLVGLTAILWGGVLLARAGKRVAERAGVAYERIEILGRALREVAPGVVQELPVNLSKRMGVLDVPAAYSELRLLAAQQGEPPAELAVDLLTGAIAGLVGRDDVVLARRKFPLETRGRLTRSTSTEVSRPVITRRRAYVGPGRLEARIAQILRTDQPLTVEELVGALLGPERRRGAQQVVAWVSQALEEHPPDLDALSSPDDALAELERFREAMRRADPELYELLESEISRELGAAVERSVPSSILDLARYVSATDDRSGKPRRRSNSQRTG